MDTDENDSNWQKVKRHRNRVNSQKTRNRERDLMDQLNNQKTCLYLANTALQFQNQHIREAIQQIRNRLMASNTNIPAVIPATHPGIATTQQSPSLHPQVMLPTPTMPPPLPHNPVLQQQTVPQGNVQQIVTNSGVLQHQVSVPPANVQQVALALQNELTTSPLLSSALNAGLLQWSMPVTTMQEAQVQPQMPVQNASALASLQLAALGQLAANTTTNIQGAQFADCQQQQQNEHQVGKPP